MTVAYVDEPRSFLRDDNTEQPHQPDAQSSSTAHRSRPQASYDSADRLDARSSLGLGRPLPATTMSKFELGAATLGMRPVARRSRSNSDPSVGTSSASISPAESPKIGQGPWRMESGRRGEGSESASSAEGVHGHGRISSEDSVLSTSSSSASISSYELITSSPTSASSSLPKPRKRPSLRQQARSASASIRRRARTISETDTRPLLKKRICPALDFCFGFACLSSLIIHAILHYSLVWIPKNIKRPFAYLAAEGTKELGEAFGVVYQPLEALAHAEQAVTVGFLVRELKPLDWVILAASLGWIGWMVWGGCLSGR